MDVARMHQGRTPTSITYADVCQDARTIGLARFAQGYRGAWLATRIWGDMKDKYGREWRDQYREQADTNPRKMAPVSYDDPDPTVALDIHAALEHLDHRQRYSIIECDMNERGQADVAKDLSISVCTLKKVLGQAREILRERLHAYA